MTHDFVIFAGTVTPDLASKVAHELGVELGACICEQFPDGEVSVRLLERVRRKEAFLVQSTSPPVDEHLIELLAFVDACRRAGAPLIAAAISPSAIFSKENHPDDNNYKKRTLSARFGRARCP